MLLSQNGSHRPRFYVYVYEHKEKNMRRRFHLAGPAGGPLDEFRNSASEKSEKVSSFPQLDWQIPEFVK